MSETCAECGARLEAGETCEGMFHALLALEFSDPGFGEVHFLTVACYMIQHGRYSDEGLAWIRGMLRRSLEEGLPAEEIRRLAGLDATNEQRRWKVTRAPDAPPLPRVRWRVTIADVARGYQDAESYRGLVRGWARETLAQMDEG